MCIIVPGEHEYIAPALGFCERQDLLYAAEEAEDHGVIGRFLRHRCDGTAAGDHIGDTEADAVLCQDRSGTRMPLHCGDPSHMG